MRLSTLVTAVKAVSLVITAAVLNRFLPQTMQHSQNYQLEQYHTIETREFRKIESSFNLPCSSRKI
jgi:hypothetical protein